MVEVYQSASQMAKVLKVNRRAGAAAIKERCEEVWVNGTHGKRRLVGYCIAPKKNVFISEERYRELTGLGKALTK